MVCTAICLSLNWRVCADCVILTDDCRSILNDPVMYPEPKRFIPERYLNDGKPDSTVRDPATVVFGYGRRSVPLSFTFLL